MQLTSSRLSLTIIGLLLLTALLPLVASASTVLRTGDAVSVTAEQRVEGDFYAAGSRLDLAGTVAGDTLMAGGQIRHRGTTTADVHLVGGQVEQVGQVGDDVRIVGGEVFIDGSVAGDLVVVAGRLTIASTANIAGDVLMFGGEAEVRGAVGQQVLGFVDRLRIDGSVAGDVDVSVGQLEFGDRATVSGAVRYESFNELTRAQNTVVDGEITRTEPTFEGGVDTRFILVPLLVLLFAALSCFLLVRRPLAATAEAAGAHPARAALIGFAVLFLTPIVVIVLTASVLGSLLGFMLLLVYALVLLIGTVFAGAVLGSLIARLLGFAATATALSVALGVLVLYALVFVPFLGPIMLMSLLALTVGAMSELLYRQLR